MAAHEMPPRVEGVEGGSMNLREEDNNNYLNANF